mgnify:CR=1 FL=1|tara:strand:+ start:881 stop:1264 length:384 start_codon:yes stop_codon:yes gene_type:complete
MELEIKQCENIFWESVRNIRNASRHDFADSSYIDEKTHESFMDKYSKNYLIAITDEKEVVGFAGVVDNDIRIAVDPDFKGLGVGTRLLKKIKNEFPNSAAKISIDNEASMRLFKSCGFIKKFYILHQ